MNRLASNLIPSLARSPSESCFASQLKLSMPDGLFRRIDTEMFLLLSTPTFKYSAKNTAKNVGIWTTTLRHKPEDKKRG